MTDFDTDILIAGGGLAGATLALAIGRRLPGWRVTVVESFPLPADLAPDDYQPSYDARSTALALGSRQIFETLGLWQAIRRQATPIQHIHVSERGRFGVTRLTASDHGQEALGYVADNRWLGECLTRALADEPAIDWQAPATVGQARPLPGGMAVEVTGEEQTRVLNTRCLVVADGGRSGLREQLGIGVSHHDYDQVALIANVSTERPHDNVAYERFTRSGPLALLPLSQGPEPGHTSALVWTLATDELDEIQTLPESARCQRLQEVFGWRLGRFTRFGTMHHYPLSLTVADEWVRPGVVLVGNAAHSLHPVAGQGFNLALRGLMVLVDALAAAREKERAPGDLACLEEYRQIQLGDQRRVVAFSDSLARLFTYESGLLGMARGAALAGLDVAPAAKGWLARQAMGMGGRHTSETNRKAW